MKRVKGSTLIELTIFITVLAVIGGSFLLAFEMTLQGQPEVEAATQAVNIAREQMELVLGQRNTGSGSLSISDLCSQSTPPAVCVSDSATAAKYNRKGYIINTTFTDDQASVGAPVRGKIVTVTVKRADTGAEVSKLQTVVTNY